MVPMEIHRSKIAAKKLWNSIRLAILLVKKGLMSKRKLIVELNMAFKRSRLVLRKPLSSLFISTGVCVSRYHLPADQLSLRRGDYEFSCGNSPSPVFSRASRLRKRHALLFPCIRSPLVVDDYEEESLVQEDEQNAVVWLPCRTPDHYAFDLAPSTGCTPPPSDCLSEEEADGGDPKVDDEAEEFIKRFYEQLRSQNRTHLLEF